MKDIVSKVAEDIAEIPGNPNPREIARIAIEAYQRELWAPTFGALNRDGRVPELRRHRTNMLVAEIMHVVGKYITGEEAFEQRFYKRAVEDLFDLFYEAGAEIITDADRTAAGLPRRDGYGLTADELRARESWMLQAITRPAPLYVDTEKQPLDEQGRTMTTSV